jgi:tRNA A-37 threonylcarbamoyl transferase component Bud32
MPLTVGEEFAGYTILQVLGAGAMGTVYLVQHPRLPRHDALKVLSVDLTTDPQYQTRFLREADIAATLSHPNIIGIHDRGVSGDQFWIAIDFVRGTDPAKLLHEHFPRGIPVGVAMQIIDGVGSALDYAHQRGLLHRDVKPANILIADPGSDSQRVFLADFGIARHVDDTGLTATNIAVGTVAYAAPEQLTIELIDGRADQYALACTAFHLLTGSQPYDHPSAAVVIGKHVMAPPPPISERIPELAPLDPAFAKAMAKKPADRFARCQDFTHELQRALDAGADATRLAPRGADATQLAPLSMPAAPPTLRSAAKPATRRTRIVVAAVAVIALLVGVGIFAAVKLTGNPGPAAPKAQPSNSGPFTGTYTADFGPKLDVLGKEVPNAAPPGKETWNLRSTCGTSGCVATAKKTAGPFTGHAADMTFDDIAGRWIAVYLQPTKCQGRDVDEWTFIWLQPRPDGSMSGDWISDALDCYSKRSVTFTQNGDTDVASLPDPAAQPARVVSAGQGLRGVYHSSVKFTSSSKTPDQDFRVDTACLRSGDRCISRLVLTDGSGGILLFFANGAWTRTLEDDYTCGDGRTEHRKISTVFPAPTPPQDPIAQLTGRGYKETTGSSCKGGDFQQVLNRTGN